ncbi:MAG TPA: alpha/beta hydrolase [Myxococcota bacterium]|nr:alpha/beta hydrolase [Myxococcota bacterium]
MTSQRPGKSGVADLGPQLTGSLAVRDRERLFFGEWLGEAPCLVAIHGLTSTHRNFGAIARALGGRLRVVAPDLLGRGNSSTPAAGGYGMERHARDVLALMDSLEIERAIAIGHSMGAYVATALAELSPERVAGVVLLDGGVYLAPSAAAELDPEALMAVVLGPVVARLGMSFATVDAYLDYWRESPYFADAWGPIPEDYVLYDLGRRGRHFASKCDSVAAAEDWRDLVTNDASRARLSRLRCPVLAIGAESGLAKGQPAVLGEPHFAVLRSAVPNVKCVQVANTAHHTIALSEHGAQAVARAVLELSAGAR